MNASTNHLLKVVVLGEVINTAALEAMKLLKKTFCSVCTDEMVDCVQLPCL